ncbi:MAG: discoidin domain-containing protein [Thermoplasmata archaeon]|nr:discoidin domain-containing protein [Thermoplasmata archaeon]
MISTILAVFSPATTSVMSVHENLAISATAKCIKTYYFDSYYPASGWTNNPQYMVDGNISTFASTSDDEQIEMLDGNTCLGTELGTITKVEIRAYGYYASSGNSADIRLTPFFPIMGTKNTYVFDCTNSPSWSAWFDITNDSSAPEWSFSTLTYFDCQVKSSGSGNFILNCAKVIVRVTYIPCRWLNINSNNYDSSCGNDGSHTCARALDGIDDWEHTATETHWFIVDLKGNYSISKVRGKSVTTRDPTNVNIYISLDKSDWGTPIAAGISWSDAGTWREFATISKVGRYVKVEIIDTEHPNDYVQFGSMPKPMKIFDVYGCRP